jgi:uracil-DNA glycosylase
MTEFKPQFPKSFKEPPISLMLLGEAPGAEEEKEGRPFIGRSGQLLRKTLSELEIDPEDVYISNVFWERPPDNQVDFFFSHKTLRAQICEDIEPIGNKFLKEEHRHHLERLRNELEILKPKVIIATGKTPLWALTGADRISDYNGKIINLNATTKLLAVYHPSYILRNRTMIPIWRDQLAQVKQFI